MRKTLYGGGLLAALAAGAHAFTLEIAWWMSAILLVAAVAAAHMCWNGVRGKPLDS